MKKILFSSNRNAIFFLIGIKSFKALYINMIYFTKAGSSTIQLLDLSETFIYGTLYLQLNCCLLNKTFKFLVLKFKHFPIYKVHRLKKGNIAKKWPRSLIEYNSSSLFYKIEKIQRKSIFSNVQPNFGQIYLNYTCFVHY